MASRDDDIISVAELGRRLKGAVEAATSNSWVEGEIASLKRAASGHCYFTLRDEREDASIDCVMYRFQAQRVRRLLEEGARVQLFGRGSFWVPRGRLQFVAERARPAGRGALLEALEKLKQKLAAEGLFDVERKRPLSARPQIIGVVTSGHGAAFEDIRTVAFRRGGVKLVLSPALVQGEAAPNSIVAALDLLEKYSKLDTIIVGRGGGSGEDLMAFNDERVVRRVAACGIPVVSAVGHEIDTTLTDLVADRRAATPSQAAEIAVPDQAAQARELAHCLQRASRALTARLAEDSGTLARLRGRLSDPRFLIAERQQRLDEYNWQLERQISEQIRQGRDTVASRHGRLLARHPARVIAESRATLSPLEARMIASARFSLQAARNQFTQHVAKLEATSPLAVLGRGYAIATDSQGQAVRDAADLSVGAKFELRVRSGSLSATVSEVRPAKVTGEGAG